MAATFERFEKATEKTIQQLKDGSKNINTAKSTILKVTFIEETKF